jgi:hypothetical protein
LLHNPSDKFTSIRFVFITQVLETWTEDMPVECYDTKSIASGCIDVVFSESNHFGWYSQMFFKSFISNFFVELFKHI